MQSRILVILLVLLFGFTGIHRFYLRYNKVAYYMMALFFSFLVFVGLGFLNLASGSLLAIFLWWIYETFIVVTGKLKFYQSEILNDKQDIQNNFQLSQEKEFKHSPSNTKNEKSTLANGFENISANIEKSGKENEKQDDSKN